MMVVEAGNEGDAQPLDDSAAEFGGSGELWCSGAAQTSLSSLVTPIGPLSPPRGTSRTPLVPECFHRAVARLKSLNVVVETQVNGCTWEGAAMPRLWSVMELPA